MAGSARHEVPVHTDVLLQELPEHCEDQQLHQLPELLPAEGASHQQLVKAEDLHVSSVTSFNDTHEKVTNVSR